MRIISILFLGLIMNMHTSIAEPLSFSFSPVATDECSVRVSPETDRSEGAEYGFSGLAERRVEVADGRAVVTSAEPFFFHVKLPEGNYRVWATVGGLPSESATTIKAETRRLMAKDVRAAAGDVRTVEFLVNVRTPALPGGSRVALKPREMDALHWDNYLTLEFGGENPALASLEILPAPEAITLHLAGDSTVTDQSRDPWCGWGQMLPRYFGPAVSVANHAASGLSVRSFIAQGRLEKIMSTLQAGDYVLVQFGHNDQKESGEGIGPFESYTEALRDVVDQVRARQATPVFVTSMYRRRFSGNEMQDTLGDYPVAMRRLAEELKIPLIDLHAGSRVIFEALGAEGSKKAFVHYPANTFPGQMEALRDNSHFSTYGADLLARYVAKQLGSKAPELAPHLADDLERFDPGAPPPPGEWRLSLSPAGEFVRPEGS